MITLFQFNDVNIIFDYITSGNLIGLIIMRNGVSWNLILKYIDKNISHNIEMDFEDFECLKAQLEAQITNCRYSKHKIDLMGYIVFKKLKFKILVSNLINQEHIYINVV